MRASCSCCWPQLLARCGPRGDIPIFALIAALIFAEHLSDLMKARGWDRGLTRETPRTSGSPVLSLLLLIAPLSLAAFQFWRFCRGKEIHVSAENSRLPLLDFIQQQHLPGPIYNRYGWGGYLIFRLYPEYRVYVDGAGRRVWRRFPVRDGKHAYDGRNGWREPLDRNGVRTALISPDVPLASLLLHRQGLAEGL